MKKIINYTVRNAGFEDAVAICSLLKEYPEEVLPRSMGDIVQNIDRFIVCKVNDMVVGTVAWQILPEIGQPANPSIEIKSVAVAQKLQHKGIGTAMVRTIIRRIKTFHPLQIVVLTFHPPFFEKFGFKQVPKEKLMHKLYMGCINCTKYDSPFTCPEVAMILSVKKSTKNEKQFFGRSLPEPTLGVGQG